MQIDNIQTKYTVVPLKQKQNQIILEKWVKNTDLSFKASMCRFFLRGMCIIKKQYCKFAHGMDDIIEYQKEVMPEGLNDKQIKKRAVAKKSHFNQKALFLCDLVYYNLYEFSRETNPKNPIPLEVLNTDFDVRNKLRLKFHRHHWQKFMDYVEKKHPQANFTIPFISDLYTKYGFVKPHTHCKLHMLLFWIQQNKFYVRHEVILPPLLDTKTSIIFKRYSKRPMDKIFLKDYEECQALKGEQETKTGEVDKEKLNQGLIMEYINRQCVYEKKTICKFYMKGLCLFAEQQCKYCHSFATLNYTPHQYIITEQDYFEQKALFSDPKLNYSSLFKYQETAMIRNPNFIYLNQEQLNKSCNTRQELKEILMNDLYEQFLAKLEVLYPNSRWTLPFLRRQFTNCGLNKAKVDKFPGFIDKIEDLGYEMDSFMIPPNLKKKEYIFKREPMEVMDQQISSLLLHIIEKRLENSEQQEQTIILTEPYIRKKYYEYQQAFTIPVHRYLKIRNLTLKQYIKEQMDTSLNSSPYIKRISFDLQDNISKIKQTLKQYYNVSKKRQHPYSEIQAFIIKECEQNIKNYITMTGLKWCIVGESLELHKQIYIFPDGEIMICNKKHHHDDTKKLCICSVQKCAQHLDISGDVDVTFIKQKYQNQRVVIVNNFQTMVYSKTILPLVEVVGVDLQGNLKEEGFVYLIQIGIKNSTTQKNQTFVFDIHELKNNQDLYGEVLKVIKFVMQNQQIIKVMHDCKNDSVALHYLLNSCVYPIFDTCMMQSYFDQRLLNENWKQKEQFIRSIMKIWSKTLGLNQILEKYGRPINELKDSMRKMFESSKQVKEKYFEARPIDKDFLEYSVRDVEELIDVYYVAVKQDQNQVWRQIGLCTSTLCLK